MYMYIYNYVYCDIKKVGITSKNSAHLELIVNKTYVIMFMCLLLDGFVCTVATYVPQLETYLKGNMHSNQSNHTMSP